VSECEPKSPCISVCVLDDDDICQGCFRSAGEIADWLMATDADKRAILQLAGERLEASYTPGLK
jgi:uncharacterized protein